MKTARGAIAAASNVAILVCRADARDDGSAASPGDRGGAPSEKHYPIVPLPQDPNVGDPMPPEVMMHYDRLERFVGLVDTTECDSPPRLHLRHSPNGTFPNLVLLLRFADHADRKLPSRDDISLLYNSEDAAIDDHASIRGNDKRIAPTGSVRQVYYSNSHSTFKVDTTVIDWFTLPETEAYYADGEYGLSKSKFKEAMIEALDGLDADRGFDFGAFDLDGNGYLDGFGVLHSGYGAEAGGRDCDTGAEATDRIWSHKGGIDWTSGDGGTAVERYYVSSALRHKCHSNIVRIGVLCHELGHYLGLPDLYDGTFKGNGLGAYDFMASSWGFDSTGLFPPTLSAWSKLRLGWSAAELIEADGTYELEASEYSTKVYKIMFNFPEGEYLLLENRQPLGYDSKIEQGGIAIYHIDERARGQRSCGYPDQKGWPENGKHYQVALLEASGRYDLETGANQGNDGDLWHAGSDLKELGPGPGTFPNTDSYQKGDIRRTGVRIYGFSESGNVMTFQVGGLTTEEEPPTDAPSQESTELPSSDPSLTPSRHSTAGPSSDPSQASPPTNAPSQASTERPSSDPSLTPSPHSNAGPSSDPSQALPPTNAPSQASTERPSSDPSLKPSQHSTAGPSSDPSQASTRDGLEKEGVASIA